MADFFVETWSAKSAPAAQARLPRAQNEKDFWKFFLTFTKKYDKINYKKVGVDVEILFISKIE